MTGPTQLLVRPRPKRAAHEDGAGVLAQCSRPQHARRQLPSSASRPTTAERSPVRNPTTSSPGTEPSRRARYTTNRADAASNHWASSTSNNSARAPQPPRSANTSRAAPPPHDHHPLRPQAPPRTPAPPTARRPAARTGRPPPRAKAALGPLRTTTPSPARPRERPTRSFLAPAQPRHMPEAQTSSRCLRAPRPAPIRPHRRRSDQAARRAPIARRSAPVDLPQAGRPQTATPPMMPTAGSDHVARPLGVTRQIVGWSLMRTTRARAMLGAVSIERSGEARRVRRRVAAWHL